MIRQIAYITIEESTGSERLNGIAPLIIDDFSNIEIQILEDTEYYFVLKFFYDDFTDIQDIIATISYILVGEKIYKYTVTINYND